MTYPQIAAALGIVGILLALAFGKPMGAVIGLVVLLVVYLDSRRPDQP